MNPQDMLLQQLRDIHGAPEAAWWPPAPGWWVVAAILLIALFFALRRAAQAMRDRRRKARLIGFVELLEETVDPGQQPQQYLSDLNRVFKLVALRAFPGQPCARMEGSEWVQFLSSQLTGQQRNSKLEALASGPWQPHPQFDARELGALARQWIRQHG